MTTRYPAVAGTFYEANPAALRETVEGYIANAAVNPAPEQVAGLVAPHAGFLYSGATAGAAFARARGKQPGRIVILGRSHRQQFAEAVVPLEDQFQTPLGSLTVDRDFVAAIGEEARSDEAQAHGEEHCLEVLLPFVQVALGEVPIVPVLFGTDPSDWHMRLGEKLAGMLDPGDLVIASTDLSHYLTEEMANEMDKAALERVLRRDFQGIIDEAGQGICSMCGASAVVCAMACALKRGAASWQLLDYSTSARASGDRHRVVGYGAISMEWGD